MTQINLQPQSKSRQLSTIQGCYLIEIKFVSSMQQFSEDGFFLRIGLANAPAYDLGWAKLPHDTLPFTPEAACVEQYRGYCKPVAGSRRNWEEDEPKSPQSPKEGSRTVCTPKGCKPSKSIRGGGQITMRKSVSAVRKAPLFLLTAFIPLAAASAGDLRAGYGYKDAEAPQIWSGFYFGLNGGLGAPAGQPKLLMNGAALAPDALIVPGTSCLDVGCPAALSDPAFGGGQIGFNLQRNSLVFGLEADLQSASASTAKTTFTHATNTFSASASTNLDWFGTVRGRLGMAYRDVSLVYFTGGFAFAGSHSRVTASLAESPLDLDQFNGSKPVSRSDSLAGYVVGGGIEHAFSPAWSVKAEYQYLNLGKTAALTSTISDAPVNDDSTTATLPSSDNTYHTLRFGVNYHIRPGYEPLK